MPSGRLIDVFRCVNEAAEVPSVDQQKVKTNGVAKKDNTKLQTGTPSTPTSVAFSPAGDFLATTHVDSVGVFLW